MTHVPPFHHQGRIEMLALAKLLRARTSAQQKQREALVNRQSAEAALAALGQSPQQRPDMRIQPLAQIVPPLAAALSSGLALCAPHEGVMQVRVFLIGGLSIAALVLGLDQTLQRTLCKSSGLESHPPGLWGAIIATLLHALFGLGLAALCWPKTMVPWTLALITPALSLVSVAVLLTHRYQRLGLWVHRFLQHHHELSQRHALLEAATRGCDLERARCEEELTSAEATAQLLRATISNPPNGKGV